MPDPIATTLSPKKRRLYLGSIGAFALLFFVAGVLHFVRPMPFVRIVPPQLALLGGAHFLVYLSGFFEVAGAIGLVIPKTRTIAAWGLFALLVAVYPANIYMALENVQLDPAAPTPEWIAWARLPVQFVALYGVYWIARVSRRSPAAISA